MMSEIDPAEVRGALFGALVVGALAWLLGGAQMGMKCALGWLAGQGLRWLVERL